VDEMMAGHKPAVWISDRYSAQQKHGERHQTSGATTWAARRMDFAFYQPPQTARESLMDRSFAESIRLESAPESTAAK
jgi:hypothetical protein